MTKSCGTTLADYRSLAFRVGFEEGQARISRPGEPVCSDAPEVEWVSYCEGCLIRSTESLWVQEIPPEHGILKEPEIA